MESFVNSLTAANAELALSYSETLNSLVNFNSELAYNPSTSTSSTNQRTAQLDISCKLPTKLSKNPSTYEKELRDLVLNLYSDKERAVEERNQSVDMASFTQDCMTHRPQTKGASFWGAQKITVPQPLDMMHMTEPHQGESESGSEGYGSLDNGATQIEENGIQNLQELQGYLVKLQNSKQVCIMCYVMKSSVKPDWVVLKCDHLICINCVLNKEGQLKKMKECGCGEKFEDGILHYIKTENCGYSLAMERVSMKTKK